MPFIERLVLLALKGEPPTDLNLPGLRTIDSSIEVVKEIFLPYLGGNKDVIILEDFASLSSNTAAEGLTVLYVIGHAWLQDNTYYVAALEDRRTITLSGTELLRRISSILSPSTEFLFLVDTCNAAALRHALLDWNHASLFVIFASAAEESALEFPMDSATRFAMSLETAIAHGKKTESIDASEIALNIRRSINKAHLVAPQTVDYWMRGSPIRISRFSEEQKKEKRRSKTYMIVRSLLMALGILLALSGSLLLSYYQGHFVLELIVPDLSGIASDPIVLVELQIPDSNNSRQLVREKLEKRSRIRMRLPCDDLVISVRADYADGQPREIRFPLILKPGFNPKEKQIQVVIPSTAAIKAHPGMAYIGAVEWLQGTEKRLSYNRRSFWIDISPVRVKEYLPFARKRHENGLLEPHMSVLLKDITDLHTIETLDLNELSKLSKQLNDIFDVIDTANRPIAKQDPDSSRKERMPLLIDFCSDCPAPVTWKEAEAWCTANGKRLPTASEWELSARGVDGRLFPWGNRFDAKLANVVGLPKKGQEFRMQPVDRYLAGASPFGLVDLVGNAGDWIDPEEGYSRSFVGGEYRFDPESCYVFSNMPDTGDPLPFYNLTCRCVGLE